MTIFQNDRNGDAFGDCYDEELSEETESVLKNVEFRHGTHGAHMVKETTPLPLVLWKSVIPQN